MSKMRIIAAAAVAAVTALPGLATAQEQPQPGEVQVLVQEYREVAAALGEIRDRAVQANPELENKSQAFQARVEEAMVADGYDLDASRERIERLGAQLESEEIDAQREQELVAKLRTEQVKMHQARQSVMQKPEIEAAGQALQQATLVAMREQNSDTDVLMKRLRELRGEIQAQTAPGSNSS